MLSSNFLSGDATIEVGQWAWELPCRASKYRIERSKVDLIKTLEHAEVGIDFYRSRCAREHRWLKGAALIEGI